MSRSAIRTSLAIVILAAGLGQADPAHALRCGNKLVRDGMHEAQVIAICGEPTTRREIGRTLRGPDLRTYPSDPRYPTDRYYFPIPYPTEVIVTEYIYNFGPRRLMRRMIFEGGVLVSIESIGYGYVEK
jgi:hypothetical protein